MTHSGYISVLNTIIEHTLNNKHKFTLVGEITSQGMFWLTTHVEQTVFQASHLSTLGEHENEESECEESENEESKSEEGDESKFEPLAKRSL